VLCINYANSVFVKSWKNERHLKCLLFTCYSFTSDDTIFFPLKVLNCLGFKGNSKYHLKCAY